MIRVLLLLLPFLLACGKKAALVQQPGYLPQLVDNGREIIFSHGFGDSIKTEKLSRAEIHSDFTVPGSIAAAIAASNSGAGQNLALFDNPELSGNYTLLIQHQITINQIQRINIKQKETELGRIKDLYEHGAATGQEWLNAQTALSMEQTNLANERAAIIEHEVKLKTAGFSLELLRAAAPGMAFIICDVPENQISRIKNNDSCKIKFTAFPEENFTGKIEGAGEVVDNQTRMVKVRILIRNSTSKLKAGMFASVSFQIDEGRFLSISKNSLVTVQGKSYVFKKTGPDVFRRCEISVGQQLGDRITVLQGLNSGDEVASEEVMQLKGLSFGY